MPVPESVSKLIDRFERNRDSYRASSYNEAQLRQEFLNPFFAALGWDVDNREGYAEAYKDAVHEDSIRTSVGVKAPDYCFRIGGARKFFVEAKKPAVDVGQDAGPAFQLRRYAWSAKLPLSILTDFEEFAVYDCRVKPVNTDKPSAARVLYIKYSDYADRWDYIESIFSRDAVLKGSFDKYAESSRLKKGTAEVDDAFLMEIESWRDLLARNLAVRNPCLTQRQLNFAVQRTIDRIIFLRICEDRGIENYGRLMGLTNGTRVYQRLVEAFRETDDRYNSGLFHFKPERGRAEGPDEVTLGLAIDDKPLKDIIRNLYYPDSPYEFSVLPADILGQVYEQFLGKVIRLTAHHQAKVEDKPEAKKAGGVYYTPTYIVDYIVKNTVGKLVEGKTPKQVDKLRILDPACGSGSFLIGAYQFLLDWRRDWYISDGTAKWAKGKDARVYQAQGGEWRLTSSERKRILLNNIYGVDIDAQAVEVTKLSLLLKVLESGEQLAIAGERMLPDLGGNIKCGNSLIGPDFYAGQQLTLLDDEERYRINVFDWNAEFPEIMGAGGFDAVIGNPPYVLLQDEFRDDSQLRYFRSRYAVATYKIDTYHLFMEKAIRLTASGGYCSMITPANFLTNNNLVHLRRLMLELASVEHIMVVDGGVFAGISVDNAVFVVRGGRCQAETFDVLHAAVEGGSLRPTGGRNTVSGAAALKDAHVLFTGTRDAGSLSLWQRVSNESVPLGSIAWVNFGKQLRDRRKFTADVVKAPALDAVPAGYVSCYTGSDVSRYDVKWGGLACLDDERARCGGCWDPARHRAAWKLLTRQIGRYPEFGIDPSGYDCLNTIFMVNVRPGGTDARFVLGVLNSRLIKALWLSRFYDQRRTFPKIKGTYLKELPVRRINMSDPADKARHDRMVSLVDEMLALHKQLAEARLEQEKTAIQRQIDATDRQIDLLVYELYGLTEEEIGIVEGGQEAAQEVDSSLRSE